VLKYIDACFQAQDAFKNGALGDCIVSAVTNIFANLGEGRAPFHEGEWSKKKLQLAVMDGSVAPACILFMVV